MMYENNLVASEMAHKLMHDVYHPLTACLFFDEDGRIFDLYLYDTFYCQPAFTVKVRAHQCMLISHHFDGSIHPYQEDLQSIEALKKVYPDTICSLMIYSEYNGLLQIEETYYTDEHKYAR